MKKKCKVLHLSDVQLQMSLLNKRSSIHIGVRYNGQPFPIVATASVQETRTRECPHGTMCHAGSQTSHIRFTFRFFASHVTLQTPYPVSQFPQCRVTGSFIIIFQVLHFAVLQFPVPHFQRPRLSRLAVSILLHDICLHIASCRVVCYDSLNYYN